MAHDTISFLRWDRPVNKHLSLVVGISNCNRLSPSPALSRISAKANVAVNQSMFTGQSCPLYSLRLVGYLHDRLAARSSSPLRAHLESQHMPLSVLGAVDSVFAPAPQTLSCRCRDYVSFPRIVSLPVAVRLAVGVLFGRGVISFQ